jgi:hypothetical protein
VHFSRDFLKETFRLSAGLLFQELADRSKMVKFGLWDGMEKGDRASGTCDAAAGKAKRRLQLFGFIDNH